MRPSDAPGRPLVRRSSRKRRPAIPADAGAGAPAAASAQPAESPVTRVPERYARAGYLAERFQAAARIMDLGAEDEFYIARTRAVLQPAVPDVIAAVERQLLADAETAAYFEDTGPGDNGRTGARIETLRAWLSACIDGPFDRAAADDLASLGHDLVRPRDAAERPIKARYLVMAMARLLDLVVSALACAIDDPRELASCAIAWNKRVTVELDLLLAVYGATGGSAHWY